MIRENAFPESGEVTVFARRSFYNNTLEFRLNDRDGSALVLFDRSAFRQSRCISETGGAKSDMPERFHGGETFKRAQSCCSAC